MSLDLDYDPDDQDQAETFDEDNITEGTEMPTSDMRRDVLDVTSAVGDEDDFSAEDDDDFDPDAVDEEELEMLLEQDDGVDEARTLSRNDEDLVMNGIEDTPADFEGPVDDVVDDYADDDDDGNESEARQEGDPAQPGERALDEGVEETFPASDPVSVSPGAD